MSVFSPLQTIIRNVRVNVSADDGTGRTNSINDGTFKNTWGMTAIGYTHIRIEGTDNIMRITSEGEYNFYGYFVDSSNKKLTTSPYVTTTPINSFSLGTYETRTCKDFEDQSTIQFKGKVDFSRSYSSPVPLVSGDKINECKTACINDIKCGMWSVSGSTCRKFLVDGDESTEKENGLVVNPRVMYNSGFPNSTYSTAYAATLEECKTRCRNDPRCNFFEYSLRDGTRSCKLNECSSPHPTGYTKTCKGYTCLLNRTYRSPDNSRFIKFGSTSSGSSIDVSMWTSSSSFCYNTATATISSDGTVITFTIFSVNYKILSTKTNNTETIEVIIDNDDDIKQVYTIDRITPTPLNVCCLTIPLENCVKGKEFVNVSLGITFKFDPTNLTVTVFSIDNTSSACFNNIPYTVNSVNRTLQVVFETVGTTTYVISSITSDYFYVNRTRTIRGITTSRLQNVKFDLKRNLETLSCTGGGVLPSGIIQPGSPTGYQINLSGLKFRGIDPDVNSVRDTITIIFHEEYPDTLFMHTPSKGCQLYSYTLNTSNFSVSFGDGYTLLNFTTSGCNINQGSTSEFLQIFTEDFDISMCRGKTCAPNEFKICNDSVYLEDTETCDDGSMTECVAFCSRPGDVCPNPFIGKTIKFVNDDDYGDRITIIEDEILYKDEEGNDLRYYFIVKKWPDDYRKKIIISPDRFFVYEEVDINSVDKMYTLKPINNSEYTVYKDIRSYFYKKTFISPVSQSLKNVTRKNKNCSTNFETDETVSESILYYCLTFESYTVYRFTVLRKSQVVAFHDDNSTNVTYFEHLVDPGYEPNTGYGIGNWSVNSSDETLTYDGARLQQGTTLLEEYENFDMTLYNLNTREISIQYGGNPNADNHYTIKNLICSDLNSSQQSAIRNIGIDPTNLIVVEFPNDDHRPPPTILRLTRKDTGQSVILELVSVDTNGVDANRMRTDPNYYWRKGIAKVLDIYGNTLTKSGFPFYESSFSSSEKRISIRVSYMRRRTVPVFPQSSLPINSDTGDLGIFFTRYDCQLLSGVEGYNRCSTKVTGNFLRNKEQCTDVIDAANKCDLREWCIGFEYDTSDNTAKFLTSYHLETVGSFTNRNEIVIPSRSDGFDYRYSIWQGFTSYPGYLSDPNQEFRIHVNTLFHNIFPSEKVSPLTDDSVPSSEITNVNDSFTGNLKSPVFGNRVFQGSVPFFPPQEGTFSIAFNNTRQDTRILYLKSNIPNVYGKSFVGIYHKKRLPKTYSGLIGKKSVPRDITVTSITIDGVTHSNKLLRVYRVTEYSDMDVFLLATEDDRFIKNDGTTSDVSTENETLWNIVLFTGYERKLFLVSLENSNTVLELDLSSDFQFPLAFTDAMYSLELDDSSESCRLIVDGTTYNYFYYYAGNDLVVYDKTCKSDGTEEFIIKRRFRFKGKDCDLYDLATNERLNPTRSSKRGSFVSYKTINTINIPGRNYGYVYDNYVTSMWGPIVAIQQNPILGILNLAVIGGALPPAVIGDMDAKTNGLWFGLFFAGFIPFGSLARLAGPLLRLPSIALKIPRIGFRFRIPRVRTGGRIPDTPLDGFPSEGPILGPIESSAASTGKTIISMVDDFVRVMPKIPKTPIRSMPRIPRTPIGGSTTPAPARPAANALSGRVPTKTDASKFAKQSKQTAETTANGANTLKPTPENQKVGERLSDISNMSVAQKIHHINQAIKANRRFDVEPVNAVGV